MSQKIILIVDDSETLRGQLRKTLESAQYQVLEAVDGMNGLNQFKENAGINLVISDVNMPVMDGLTMAQRIRETDTGKTVPIFMLTTESGPEMKARGKEAGVTAWVTKPYNADTLLKVIVKVLSK